MRNGRGRRRLGLGARVLVLHGVALGAVLGAVTVEVVHGFSTHYEHTIVADLSEEGPEYARAAAHRPAGQTMAAFARSFLRSHALPAGHVAVVALRGRPVLASDGGRQVVAGVGRLLRHPPTSARLTTVHAGGAAYLALATPIHTPGGATVGVLVAAANLSHLHQEQGQVLALAGAEAVVAVVAALLSSYLVLRRVVRTVGAVTKAAVEATVGDLGARFGADGADDELGQLTAAFDGMLERIAAGLDAQRQLLSDVSHQLRTPLTVARGHLEVLGRNPAADHAEVADTATTVIGELEGLATLVDRLLLLGRSFSADFVEAEPVAVRVLMAELLEASRMLADRRWALGEVEDVVVLVDPAKLRGALLNLADNAVKATGPGDAIELAARRGDGGAVVLAVSDTGAGIDPEVRAELFERFRRAGPPDRRGAGLGLAIVRAVAEAHGGHVRLDSTEGIGTTVEIVLPASRRLVGSGSSDDDAGTRPDGGGTP